MALEDIKKADFVAINKALQAIGKRFFVMHFDELTASDLSHSDIARTLSKKYNYAFPACKVRVNKSRKLLATFSQYDIIHTLVTSSPSMQTDALANAKKLLKALKKEHIQTGSTAQKTKNPKNTQPNKQSNKTAAVQVAKNTQVSSFAQQLLPVVRATKLRHLKRGSVNMLPNFFTLCGLFFGFLSIVLAMRGEHLSAMYCIAIAAFFDGIDGKIARMINMSSRLGVELDSIADMVSFGVAPAIFLLSAGLDTLGTIGWAVTFLYVVAAALRLARFNVLASDGQSSGFLGLPSPAAAGVVVLTFLMLEHLALPADAWWRTVVIAVITLLAACSMMSSLSYGKIGLLIAPLRPFWRSVLVAVMLALAVVDYLVFPCLVVLAYWLAVPVLALVRFVRRT